MSGVGEKVPPLTTVDAAFFHLESHDTPMHVGALQIFSRPSGAGPDYLHQLVAQLRSPRRLASPWNLKLRRGPGARLAPRWIVDHDVDLDYHVRHLALPQPGGERELGVLVSRLHAHRLDRRRPLWECHVIEGLEGNRFALFTKIHHALVDGVTTMRLLTDALARDAETSLPPPWAMFGSRPGPAAAAAPRRPRRNLVGAVRERAAILGEVTSAFGRLFGSVRGDTDRLAVPFTAPHSAINGRVTARRRLATQQFALARVKAVAKAGGGTLNDVVLALSAAALRRFLQDMNSLPSASLVASVPVSLRGAGEATGGNAVSMMFTRLGTELADPRARLDAIQAGSRQAKEHLQQLGPRAQATYTQLLLLPFVGQTALGLGGRSRPYFNVTVSNVPGPGEPRWLNGARLEAMVPVSIATHGQALNVTVTSYAGTLNFGFVGCPDTLPSMQHLALYIADALAELEAAFGIDAARDGERRAA